MLRNVWRDLWGQLKYVLVYWLLASFFLSNTTGGADILFEGIVGLALLIHIIILFFKWLWSNDPRQAGKQLLFFLLVAILCFFVMEPYLRFVWHMLH